METTNDELMARINVLEAKVDVLASHMDQAMGAWLFVKILASCAIGFTVILGFIKDWVK